jgi:hypothetical protein
MSAQPDGEAGRVIVENAQRSHAAENRLRFALSLGAHPLLTAWYAQRIIRLWQSKRTREALRTPSSQRLAPPEPSIRSCGAGPSARVTSRDLLAEVLGEILRAVVLEGHTSSRNPGGEQFDWETEARQNRVWIRQQDAEYLRLTGLQDVLARHHAEYVNVTEAFWDEDCPGDPTQFVPKALMELRGCPPG